MIVSRPFGFADDTVKINHVRRIKERFNFICTAYSRVSCLKFFEPSFFKMCIVIDSAWLTFLNVAPPKTEKTRAVILPEYAVEQLKEWKEIQSKELIALEVKPTEDTFIYGRSWDGGVIKPDSLSAEFRKAIREIPNFPIVRLHDLRHSHATQLLAEGIHPKIAQERLGHSTITTTMDLYSHASETMQNDAASKLDSAFRSAIRANSKLTPKLG